MIISTIGSLLALLSNYWAKGCLTDVGTEGVAGAGDEGEPRYLEGAPLFVVEVLSPDNTIAQQLRKLDEYFSNGCKLAWLVLPDEESVLVRAPGKDVRSYVKGDLLDGGDALPELELKVSDLFE